MAASPPTPQLRVLAGPPPSRLTDISALVNTVQPHTLQSDRFAGKVVVHIKGFLGADISEYFERDDRRGVTWSIQVQNPTLEHDLRGPKPWALSPLITTMPHFVHTEVSSPDAPLEQCPPPAPKSIKDDTKLICRRRHPANGFSSKSANGTGGDEPRLTKAFKRRAYFANKKNRGEVTLGPEDVLTTDFCYGFLSFPSLALNLPGGISFDLKKYWDGQPVRFVCVNRQRSRQDGEDGEDDNMFWCVVVETAED